MFMWNKHTVGRHRRLRDGTASVSSADVTQYLETDARAFT